MAASAEQVKACVAATVAIGQAVKEAGTVPTGTLYAAAAGVMSLETFNGIIDRLVSYGLITRDALHRVTWVG
jgi:hypothetical protein